MGQSQGSGFAFVREFSQFRVGDRRIEGRFFRVMEKMMENPGASINAAMCSVAEAKAAYRLFGHARLEERKILAAHRKSVIERARGGAELLLVQDTTTLVYTSHAHVRDLGSVAQGARNSKSRGIFVHTAYALDQHGVPLGILGQCTWSREQLEEGDELWYSESNRWKELVRENAELPKETGARVVHVCDREGDFWDLLSEIHEHGASFVIRAIRQPGRRGPGRGTSIEESFGDSKPLGHVSLEIQTRAVKGAVRDPGLRETVELEVSAVEQDLRRTTYFESKNRARGLRVFLVRAREVGNAEGTRDPIEWFLKTDRPVTSLDQALRVIEIYRHRWQIENFHKVLKSGCQVEKARLQETDSLKRYITAMSVVAWRLHYLTWAARKSPEESCLVILKDIEWKALYCKIHRTSKLPQDPPSVRQAVRWIAQMGGFLGRKGDGEPGTLTLWRGWQKLSMFIEAYEILAPLHAPG